MEFFQIALELTIGFIALFIITKILGKTQITQITAFDFISALVLGELVGNAVYDDKIGLKEILFTTLIWGILIFIIEMITQKWKGSRSMLEGRPSIVIHDGKISRNALKQSKLDINQLQHLLRAKSVFSIREVQYAVLETDGSVSVMKKPAFDTPTNNDLKLKPQKVALPVTLIIDGEVLWDNLKEAKFSEDWLKKQLNSKNILRYEDVFYAEWLEGEGLFLQSS